MGTVSLEDLYEADLVARVTQQYLVALQAREPKHRTQSNAATVLECEGAKFLIVSEISEVMRETAESIEGRVEKALERSFATRTRAIARAKAAKATPAPRPVATRRAARATGCTPPPEPGGPPQPTGSGPHAVVRGEAHALVRSSISSSGSRPGVGMLNLTIAKRKTT